MEDSRLKEVVAQLKLEGALLRDTGKNSIESTKSVLEDISIAIVDQNSILRDMFTLDQGEAKDAENRRRLGEADNSSISPSPGSQPNGRPAEPQAAAEYEGLSSLFSSIGGIGIVAGSLAAGLGVTAGIVLGQLAAVNILFPKTIKALSDSLTFIKGMFAIDSTSVLGKAITGIKTGLDALLRPFSAVARGISSAVRTAVALLDPVTAVIGNLMSFGGVLKSVAKTVGRIFAPITVILTLFDTISGGLQGFAEGFADGNIIDGILGGLRGAIQGFFNSILFGPLDLLKDLVSWISTKLGFENFSAILDKFSFAGLFTKMTDSLFKSLTDAFAVITDLFTFGEEDMTAMGLLGKLNELVYAPVNMAINFVRGIFGFDDNDQPFKLQDWIGEKVGALVEWFGELFGFIPSMNDAKKILMSYMPDWLRPDSIDEQRQSIVAEISKQQGMINSGDERDFRLRSRKKIVANLQQDLAALPQYSEGTSGFANFGRGMPAMLHGIEAVVPRNTPAGEFLAANFDKNWEPTYNRMQQIESAAIQMSGAPIIIANAPTIAPVNNNIGGNTSYSSHRVTAIGGSGGSGLGRFAN